jgi:hypothetical protein
LRPSFVYRPGIFKTAKDGEEFGIDVRKAPANLLTVQAREAFSVKL